MPTILRVICHADGSTELLDDEVHAGADGVHIEVDNRAAEFVSLNGTGLDFSKGISEQVALVEPGDAKIACWPGSMHTQPEPDRVTVTVLDPEGVWVEAELQCPKDDLIESAVLDYTSSAHGDRGDPEDLARDRASLKAGNEVVASGYPEGDPRSVAIRRNDEIVAILQFSGTENGGWLLGGYEACPSAHIDV